jgi:hypothetical protein
MRRRKRRLNRADLPTLGRPTIATVGTLAISVQQTLYPVKGYKF